ncbi:MAG: hypothetical protein ACPG7F_03815 [Aggregatilineales bacterium]
MARRQRNAIFSTAMMIVIVMSFLTYLFVRADAFQIVPPAQLIVVFTGMLLATIALSAASYGFAEFQQRRAFSGKKMAADTTQAHQQRTIEIDLPMGIAFDLALEALQTLDNQKVPMPDTSVTKHLPRKQRLALKETDREMGIIRAGLRLKLPGITDPMAFSQLAIHLQHIDAHSSRIRIESKATSFVDDYDMGKNLHYVNELARYIRRESQQHNAALRLQSDADDAVMDEPLSENDIMSEAKNNFQKK